MEFLNVLETLRAEEASVQRLFGSEGVGMRHVRRSPEYQRKLGEAATFVAEVYEGRRPLWQLREALGTGDFPNLFGDIIDRQLLARYRETTPTYRSYCRIATVPDFRAVKRFAVDGSEATLSAVSQQEQYPESKLTDTAYSYSVSKYGRTTPLSWEAFINDDLDALKDLPDRYARAARRSEEKFATQLFVDANGPNANLYTAGNKNIINATNAGGGFTAVNPALSISGLQEGFAVLNNMRDTEGEPITVDAVYLVVPPAMEVTVLNILNSTELWITGDQGGGTSGQQVHVANWLRNRLTLLVNAYVPIVASTANANTSWFMFATPSAGRPALEMGFLRGHDAPELFVKEADAIRIGGGPSDPTNGDFDSDSIRYKIRHVFGGTRLDPKSTVGSNGSGA